MGLDKDVEEQIHDFELILILKTNFHHFDHSVYLSSFFVEKVNHDKLDQHYEDIVDIYN